ncbi:hypothetical protein BC938DRAFT_478663 [Jimgerdemannia flammicorona]|uniref:PQ loop repeat-domain-containing protein n=1 Tax=Jimgerdemannia flammicorona TaxID=994334 RepID=A0A433QYB1_9FUNG|nr:hypothetical protein BC938DRAFT_478663 [Jimgerdemannia flammicorona]
MTTTDPSCKFPISATRHISSRGINVTQTHLQAAMMLIWSIGSVFYTTYAIVLNLSIPTIAQPNIFTFFSNACWAQCVCYGGDWGIPGEEDQRPMVWSGGVCDRVHGDGGWWVNLDFIQNSVSPWPMTATGVIPVVLWIVGFIPQFVDIYRKFLLHSNVYIILGPVYSGIYFIYNFCRVYQTRAVQGVSRIFLVMDMTGAAQYFLFPYFCFNRHAGFHELPFDTLAAFSYISVFVLDCTIFVLSFVLPRLSRPRLQNSIESYTEDSVEVVVTKDMAKMGP